MSLRNMPDFYYRNLTPDRRERARRVHSDSMAYSQIGKRCYYCHGKITRADVTPPRQVFATEKTDKVAHDQCLEYKMKKYPDIPDSELEGKVVRFKA